VSDAIAAALMDALDDAALERLVERLSPRLVDAVATRLGFRGIDDRWLSTREAASYLGLTPNALHKLTAAREVPFSQDAPGGKCWFLKSELDQWRRGGSAFHLAPTCRHSLSRSESKLIRCV
jgi:excisionase family DNA binding protein